MRRYWEIDQTFAQPSESLLKKNLKESVKKQKEKGNKLEPVVISGRTIAKSWWGKAWCDNLERSRFARSCSFFAKTAVRSLSLAFTIPSTAIAHSPMAETTILSSKESIGLFPTKMPTAP